MPEYIWKKKHSKYTKQKASSIMEKLAAMLYVNEETFFTRRNDSVPSASIHEGSPIVT